MKGVSVVNRRFLRTGVLLAGVGLLALAVWRLWPLRGTLADRAKDFDIVGMLKAVGKANDEIYSTNGDILVSLEGVGKQAQKVSAVHQRLVRLSEGVAAQQQVLNRIRQVTADQVDLSQTLQSVTAAAAASTAGVAATAREQAGLVSGMQDSTEGLAAGMADIQSLNETTLGKLQQAEDLSATVLSRMP